MFRNQWSQCSGIGGNFAPEYALSEMTPPISFQCCVYALRSSLFFMATIDKTLFNEVHNSAKVWVAQSNI
jgi:hypothetical protein